MTKIPKKADKAIELLDGLVEQLHYFYTGNDRKFKDNVLKDAIQIENVLKDLAVNKKETFKRIAKRYEEYYRKKQEAIDNSKSFTNDSTNGIRDRYRHDFKEDRK